MPHPFLKMLVKNTDKPLTISKTYPFPLTPPKQPQNRAFEAVGFLIHQALDLKH